MDYQYFKFFWIEVAGNIPDYRIDACGKTFDYIENTNLVMLSRKGVHAGSIANEIVSVQDKQE